MHYRLIILALILYFQVDSVPAQTPSYYHYTSSDGLASSTVYHIIQDRNGFVWFATINGISKFDGKTFTTFRTSEGLNSNSIISLLEGRNGELYIGNYEKGINILKNGKIENYCREINGKNFATSYLMLSYSGFNKQKLYTYRSWGNINIISQEKPTELITKSISTQPVFINKLAIIPSGEILALTPVGLFNFKNEKLSKLTISGLPDIAMYCLTSCEDGSYLIGTKGMIYKIKYNKVVGQYKIKLDKENNVIAMLRDKNKNLWFSIMNRGFFLIPNGSEKIIDIGVTMGLQNTLVNNYLEDNEGNIWLSTFGKGVYCLNNLYLKSYSERDGMSNNNVYSIEKERSGKLLIGTFNGINLLENGRFNQIKSHSDKTLTEYIYRIKNFNDEFYVCGAFGGNVVKNILYRGIHLHLFNGPSFCKTSEGLYLFGTGGNSIVVQRELKNDTNQSKRYYIFGDSPNINRVNDIFEDSNNNIWVGTTLGLCKISGISNDMTGWKKSFFPSCQSLNEKINSITEDDEKNIWISGDKGIAKINPKDDSIKELATYKGYDLSSSAAIVSDNKQRIWIGNMKGLYLLEGDSVKHLNIQTGLPSDEVYTLFYDKIKNDLFIGTGNGISILDISLFDKYHPLPPDVKITEVKAGDAVFANDNNLTLNPDQHNVNIEFGAISLSSPGSVKYKYNLNGEWAETDHNFLNFISLEKGKYDLQIMAKSQNSNWGSPSYLKFEIKPRYNETIWFKLGRILFIILVSISLVTLRWRLKNKKIREELKLSERINELKHQALSAMMNPHFIFNSLNSVQFLINSQRNEEANDYIAMMAKLIRKNLDTAGNGFIFLSEEIIRLKLYLDLEKLRFQESFSYEIVIGNDIDTDKLMIPNMIIQPFVENTLWHGIINSGMQGIVTISFLFEEVDIDSVLYKSFIIKVTDNGIGIIEAKKHKKEDHISKGIQIIEERLRLLSTKMQLPKPIILEDLSNRKNDTHGTEVIISLPPPLYKIIGSN